MPIHKEFADWYRTASVVPTAETLESRWGGVEEVASALTASNLVVVLRLFCVGVGGDYQTPEFLDAAFRKHDSGFPSRGNIAELRVLAGAILRFAIEAEGVSAVPAALGLLAGTYCSRKKNLPTVEHVEYAEQFAARRATAIREAKAAPAVRPLLITKEKFEELMPPAVFAANQTPNAREPLFATFNEQATRHSQNINTVVAALWRTIQSQREELNLLWWLQARFSRDLGKTFSEMSKSEASLIMPEELADLTAFVPGPASIRGMLIAALEMAPEESGALTIAKTVASTPRNWRQQRSNASSTTEVRDLCPISLALVRSLDTDGESDWLPVYRKQCDVNIEEATSAVEIAMQVYRERTFIRSLTEMKK